MNKVLCVALLIIVVISTIWYIYFSGVFSIFGLMASFTQPEILIPFIAIGGTLLGATGYGLYIMGKSQYDCIMAENKSSSD